MKNEIVKVYNDGSMELNVEFKVIDGEVYAKANSMCEPKQLENWKNSVNTKRYLEALKNKDSLKSRELILSKRGGEELGGGTWIHEKLILNLARYVSVEFELWCDEIIAELIRERKQVKSILTTLEYVEFKGNLDNLVYSKNGKPITTSRIISEYTNKEHKHILRDIREEIEKLNNISPNLSQSIIEDFNEVVYLDTYGREQVEYELGEMATMQILLKYSTEYRAKFILTFQNMKETLMNMFKVKVLEEVLPQDNRLRQYVYIIENQDNGAIKIGVAQNVEKRLKQLQTGSVSELILVYRSILCSNAFEVEKFMHEKFFNSHIRGEWFDLDKTIVINELEKQKFVLNSNFSAYLKTSDDFYF